MTHALFICKKPLPLHKQNLQVHEQKRIRVAYSIISMQCDHVWKAKIKNKSSIFIAIISTKGTVGHAQMENRRALLECLHVPRMQRELSQVEGMLGPSRKLFPVLEGACFGGVCFGSQKCYSGHDPTAVNRTGKNVSRWIFCHKEKKPTNETKLWISHLHLINFE